MKNEKDMPIAMDNLVDRVNFQAMALNGPRPQGTIPLRVDLSQEHAVPCVVHHKKRLEIQANSKKF
jgi:hypothetical protein